MINAQLLILLSYASLACFPFTYSAILVTDISLNVPRRRLSIDDGEGSENVAFKMNSRFFKLCRVYSNLSKMSNLGVFPWS